MVNSCTEMTWVATTDHCDTVLVQKESIYLRLKKISKETTEHKSQHTYQDTDAGECINVCEICGDLIFGSVEESKRQCSEQNRYIQPSNPGYIYMGN